MAAAKNDANANLKLGHVYYEGLFTKNINYSKAEDHYKKAYKGSLINRDMFLRLIEMYSTGVEGVEKDLIKVKEYDDLHKQHFTKNS